MNMIRTILKHFGFSIGITLLAILIAGVELGAAAVFTIIVLIAIEIAFSFDNAVINAKILTRLSRIWQQLFLTVGMVIAIFGMRFVFPILIVMVTAGLGWSEVIDDALHHPEAYAQHLEHAHHAIASFGGAFLLILTLYFLFDDLREVLWIRRIEAPLQRLGGSIWLPPAIGLAIVGLIGLFAGEERATVLQAGFAGVIAYTAIKWLIEWLGKLTGAGRTGMYTGWGAFVAFLYLEILDASFSFDGVLGAFAITNQVLLIALGLGVGAFWVRSITIYLVRQGTLNEYRYLEHGAHYAIFVLAVALLGSIFVEVPDAITGAVGLGIIGASVLSSREAAKAHAQR
jgi:uncharacterized protein